MDAGHRSPWQLASWCLLLGDAAAGRRRLIAAAAEARREWESSAPDSHRLARLLGREQALPNANFLREHFALALVVGDEAAVRDTSGLLREWDARLRLGDPYVHASGYLDVIRHLIASDRAPPSRGRAEEVAGPLRNLRVACIGLVERDVTLLEGALQGLLEEHADLLERKTSVDPPVCVLAVHVAAAADRLGIGVAVKAEAREYDVPIVLRERGGAIGRLRCDMLGTALWRTSSGM